MSNQEKFIIIETKEKNEIIRLLKDFRFVLEQAYKSQKKKSPFQNTKLAGLVEKFNDIDKTINNLEEKGND